MRKITVAAITAMAVIATAQPAFAIEAVSFAIFSALYTVGIPGVIANAISLIAIPAACVGGAVLLKRTQK